MCLCWPFDLPADVHIVPVRNDGLPNQSNAHSSLLFLTSFETVLYQLQKNSAVNQKCPPRRLQSRAAEAGLGGPTPKILDKEGARLALLSYLPSIMISV
jgi:hypothetical protein